MMTEARAVWVYLEEIRDEREVTGEIRFAVDWFTRAGFRVVGYSAIREIQETLQIWANRE